jgi:uncharacterized protein (DUF362 family)
MLKISVCLDRCETYSSEIIEPLLNSQMDILGVSADLSSKKILLKPNLLSAGAPSLACSNPLFVKAIATCFLSRGAKVLLGDSPAFGSAAQVLKRQGFAAALSGLAVEFVPFKRCIKKKLSCGVSVGIAAEALECDCFINIPRIKAHDQMGVTMAVKNVFGIVLGARKAWLHMKHGESHRFFAEMILDLQQILPSSLVFADGIEVMNRRGPMKGSSLLLGCLAASKSSVGLDRAMLEVLEVEKEMVPLAMAAEKKQREGATLQDLDFPQCIPSDFTGSGFRAPAKLSPVRFRPFRYLGSSLKRVLVP